MQKELTALIDNGKLPKGKKPISCKWVYKVKYHEYGYMERHKARLLAKGLTQKVGIDYHETFSIMMKFSTIRCMVAITVKKKWEIQQLYVNNAFLHGDLHEDTC